MARLKSETRIKEIDTSETETNESEYGNGDIVYDENNGLLRHNGSTFDGIQARFDGMFITTGIIEKLIHLGAAEMTSENYDCKSSQVFFNTTAVNWRVNLVNFDIPVFSATNVVIIADHDDRAAYWPDELTISSSATRSTALETILWAGGEAPTPTVDGVDVFCFTIFRLSSSTHYVLGQMVPFKSLS